MEIHRRGSGERKLIASDRTEDKASSPLRTLVPGERLIGMQKGYTINLDNYESARIDCWMSRVVEDDPAVAQGALSEMADEIEEQLDELRSRIL